MASSQTFGNLVRAFMTGDTTAVGTGLSGATIGMALKGMTGVALVAAGAIGGAMGVKQIVDGVGSHDEYDISAGSLNLAMGVSWAASCGWGDGGVVDGIWAGGGGVHSACEWADERDVPDGWGV
jgi:hypothetical protein